MEERNENLSFNDNFRFKNLPDESTPKSAENLNVALDNTSWLKNNLNANNAGAHNSIFRGKDITKYLDDGSLWKRISSGAFEDLFVGDYINKGGKVWRIAGFDLRLGKGDQNSGLATHHAVIVPDKNLQNGKMNDTASTSTGFSGSNMYTTILPQVLETHINPVFEEHIVEFRNLLSSGVDSTGLNSTGKNTGRTNKWNWVSQKIDLMNEVQLFGSNILSSSVYDVGIDSSQFPLFKLAPEFICNRNWFYTKSIASNTQFVDIYINGNIGLVEANGNEGIRPYFLID